MHYRVNALRDATAHAEMVAVQRMVKSTAKSYSDSDSETQQIHCKKKREDVSSQADLRGCEVYVTCEPCIVSICVYI